MSENPRNSTNMHNVQQLPPEVLTWIFLYAVPSSLCFATSSTLHPLLVITSTCFQWRRLAIEIRALWDHVDIDADNLNDERSLRLLERTQLWIERARGVPLYVHFLTALGRDPYRAARLTPILLPHAASISAWVFPRGINVHVATLLFAPWQDQAERTSLETLVLKGIFPLTLSLHWPTFRGFTNLQLFNLYGLTSPTIQNLINMISGSPRLHTLRLRNILPPFANSDPPHLDVPISLPCLRLLDLADLTPSLSFQLLAVLFPGSLPLHFRLHQYIPTIMTLRFIDRSNITSLYLEEYDSRADTRHATIPPLEWFPHLSQMRILFLSCGKHEGAQLEKLVALTHGKATALAPNLHTLVLLDSHLSDTTRRRVKCVVEAYSLRRLIFRASPNPDGRSADDSPEGTGAEVLGEHNTELSDFKTWLGQRVNIVTFEPQRIAPDPTEEWDTYMQELMSGLDA
ncbi:hypothetical protein FRC10_003249 [Ceratobasidium sp. 414]|nr:hypothetical protein FRC10_003249 [Ceratobasidium sp. 414]